MVISCTSKRIMSKITLNQLAKSQTARITHLTNEEGLKQRLIEMGLCEGLEVKLLHEGPFGRDPLAVLIEGHIVAMRRAEAAKVEVELL